MAPEPAPSKAWRVSLQLVQYGDGLVWLAEIRRPGEVIGIRVADLDAVEARTARDWAHINALIALAAAEDAAAR